MKKNLNIAFYILFNYGWLHYWFQLLNVPNIYFSKTGIFTKMNVFSFLILTIVSAIWIQVLSYKLKKEREKTSHVERRLSRFERRLEHFERSLNARDKEVSDRQNS